MIDIERIHYSNNKSEIELLRHKGWSLVLSKLQKELDYYVISTNLMHQDRLLEYIEERIIHQIIVVNLKLNCTSCISINCELNLATNPEIEVLIQLLFTRFENKDKSYSIEVAIEMILRKSFQKNANYLKNYFEIFNLIAYIRKNIYQNITVESLAKHMLMSQSTLRRFCLQKLGKTASVLIRDIRIAEAKDLLEMTDETISMIAEKLNFFNARTFSSSFQQHTGYLPKEYRECYHKNFDLIPKERNSN
ncbi:helix-turn-helix transcriptional regulator [Enterococcus casseliflavus]|uniref:helix-turn-helix transcriptional regulator n=1 Tax=Enterococcus casseliflavus TaxID=37734 RepID=UPI00232E808D|nr:helix-turn-helix transcriptional regulator [Enterococcus casseliflavus]MDB1688219.1 helix-turn-helix transcriptional regulator [Enterococcus casseliflavus]